MDTLDRDSFNATISDLKEMFKHLAQAVSDEDVSAIKLRAEQIRDEADSLLHYAKTYCK